jgi:hypothetical chaperone protein
VQDDEQAIRELVDTWPKASKKHDLTTMAPKLGLGSHYVSLGKELPVPAWPYSQLSSWHRTFLLKEPKTMPVLREVKNQASEPGKITALIQIISENLGYALYRAVQ